MLRKLFGKKEEQTDEELLAAYKRTQNPHYVGVLYQRYTHLVFGVAMKYFRDEDESQDAVMQVFEKLMQDLLHFEIANFKGWLHQVARNHCLMHLRKVQTSNKKQEEYKNIALTDMESESAAHLLEDDEEGLRLEKLQQAIAQLNGEQQQCVQLFFFDNKSYQQIADETGYSANQVKSFLQNGKRNLKNLMGTIAYFLLFWQ